MSWLTIAVLGGVGALLRVVVGLVVARRAGAGFPVGTLAANLSGAFALGVLVGIGPGGTVMRTIGTGLLGAYTTFSTWMVETDRLVRLGRRDRAFLNVVGSLVAGLALAWLGRSIGRSV